MRFLFLISALFLASCSAENNHNATTTDVSIAFGQTTATGALGAEGVVPNSVNSVSLVALDSADHIIAGPVAANRPNFLLKLRIPNGDNIRLRIRAFSLVNTSGALLYETFSAPLNLTGTPLTVPVKMNLAIRTVAFVPNPLYRNATVSLQATVSGANPTASSPLIWFSQDASGSPTTAPASTDPYGKSAEWTATDLGTFTLSARIDPSVNSSQDTGVFDSVTVTVENQIPQKTGGTNISLTVPKEQTLDAYSYAIISDADSMDTLTAFSVNKPSWVDLITSGGSPGTDLTISLKLQPDVNTTVGKHSFTLGARDGVGGENSSEVIINVTDALLPGPTTISAPIPCPAHWYASSSPYIIDTNIRIKSGCTLTIDPSVTVQFRNGKKITIESGGRLDVLGTTASIVTFNGYAAIDWDSIDYLANSFGTLNSVNMIGGGGNNSLPTSTTDAGATTTAALDRASLQIASDITVDNVQISDSYANGLLVSSGSPTINNLSIVNTTERGVSIVGGSPQFTGTNSISGVPANSSSIFVSGITSDPYISGFTTDSGNRGITVDNSASATINNNVFHSAVDAGIQLGIGSSTGKVVIKDNIINANTNAGIRIKYADANSLVQGNIIRNNGAGGVVIDATQIQPLALNNNLIVQNNGSGVKISTAASIDLYSNTIADNYSTIATGAGVELLGNVSVVLENNILASNYNTVANPVPKDIYTNTNIPTANYNIITDASIAGGTGNTSIAPTFIAGWYLNTNSSGIDAAGITYYDSVTYLSSNPYAQATKSDVGGILDLGYHYATIAPSILPSTALVLDISPVGASYPIALGGTTVITITPLDAITLNPIGAGLNVTMGITQGGTATGTLSNVKDNGDGSYEAVYTAPAKGLGLGNDSINPSVNGTATTAVTITF